ncbi:MAG: DUF58 domain-containing protein [Eubacteriales bacterium]
MTVTPGAPQKSADDKKRGRVQAAQLRKAERAAKREKKRRADPVPPRRCAFSLRTPFFVYILLLFFTYIFTQALRSPLSSVLFVFMLTAPLISAVYLLAARAAVTVSAVSSKNEIEKKSEAVFTITLSNPTFLPIPFLDCDITVPSEHGVRCVPRRVTVSMPPFSSYNIEQNVIYNYRGEYETGVSDMYFYDLFRMARVRRRIGAFCTVFVTPRRLTLSGESDVSASDVNTDSQKNILGVDRSEMSDIRDYRVGDNMKNIHWKLSSGRSELITKEYAMNSGKTTYVFADLAAHFDRSQPDIYDDDINEFAADSVIETAVAVASRELRCGNSCTLLWYDRRIEGGAAIYPMQTLYDMDEVFRVIATAPIAYEPERDAASLTALTDETQAVAMLFVTPTLDEKSTAALTAAAAYYGSITAAGAFEVFGCPLTEKIAPASLDAYTELQLRCSAALAAAGIRVI